MGDRDDAWQVMEETRRDLDRMSFQEFVRARVIASPLMALGLAITSGILAFGEAVLGPIRAFLDGLSALIGGTFAESVGIIQAGAEQAAWSFTDGTAQMLGPAAFPVAVATVIAGLWVFVTAYNRMRWNPFGWLGRFR